MRLHPARIALLRPGLPACASVLALLVALALAGCGGVSGTLAPNQTPETVVFVSSPVDTVNHVVTLRWYGSDPDGVVARYEFKWVYEPGPSPPGYDSTAWTATTRTDSVFSVYTPTGYSAPTFVVRSVDNEGAADPTPARTTFQFKNDPPTVKLIGTPILPPTTYPVATVRWTSSDPDGDIRRASYLVWLDGNESAAVLVPAGNEYTIPPAAFSDGAGGYVAGPHTVSIRCIDEGGSASASDSYTWNVIAPQGDVLLVDDVPVALSAAVDPMYRNALNRQLGSASAYSVIDIEAASPFRSSADITATFGFFRSVLWYQDNNASRSGYLALAEPAIRAQLAAGKNVYVCSMTLVGTAGALTSQPFLEEVVGADSVRTNTRIGTTNFSIGNGSLLHPGPVSPYDSLRAVSISTNVDALVLKLADDAAFVARPIVLDSSQTEPWVVGVDRVPPGGTGRFVFLTFPLRFLGGTPSGAPSPLPDANYGEKTVRRVLYRFGHGSAP
jgi:hypothetical protein